MARGRLGLKPKPENTFRVSIADLPKHLVLMKLYNGAKVMGLQETSPYTCLIEPDVAKGCFAEKKGRFGFYNDRILSFDITGDFVNPKSFDRHNGGSGTMSNLIKELRQEIGEGKWNEM